MTKKTVAVGMSGGVDSTAAALILLKKGYHVIGFTALMHETSNAKKAIEDARIVCKELGIQHHIVDLQDEFNDNVIKYFEDNYKNAKTPNPCTHCNINIKWGALKDYAFSKLNADLYATGHYAKIEKINEYFTITKALDVKKDQSYMLFGLSQDDLKSTIFPLYSYSKSEIRKMLIDSNISVAQNKESQDICFINPPDTTKKYLTRKFKEQEGNFVDITTGEVLGKHTGYYQYTIGQRKGIGIAAPEPLYVVKLDAVNNIVYVGFKNTLAQKSLTMDKVNWMQADNSNFKAMVKFRYNTEAKPASIKQLDNGLIEVVFDEEQSGISPGQVCVVYDAQNQYVICGGWIQA